MKKKITIIDYGLGNLLSVARAFQHIGAEVLLTSKVKEIKNASHLLLPGVGAFNKGMEELKNYGLIEAIKTYAASDKPLLGICLGMQMLFEVGEENGTHQGLGVIGGKVVKVPAIAVDGMPLKIPHIGWAKIIKNGAPPMLNHIGDDNSFYFLHSYHAVCADKDNLAAYATYGDNRITACVVKDNIFGCQFHPEKSAEYGLKLCANFMERV